MKVPVTRDLHAYWDWLRGDRGAPDRAEIDPAAIRHMLGDTFIIEIDAERCFPLRVCGARVDALWLRQQKGLLFLDWWRTPHQAEIARAIHRVINDETPLVAYSRARTQWQETAEFELLLLPLRHFGKSRSRVLGSLAPVQALALLGLRPIGPLDLIATYAPDENVDETPEELGALARPHPTSIHAL